MQSTVVCGIGSTEKLSLRDFESICLGVLEKWQLQSIPECSGTGLLERSLASRIYKEALKLGIDHSTIGTLSLENLTAIIRYMYYQQGIQDMLKFMEPLTGKVEKTVSGSEPTETNQQLSSSLQNTSQSLQTNSEKWPLTEGVKYDADKVRYDLIPPAALREVAKVFTMGARKYNDRNWEMGIKYGRVFGAVQRHLWSWMEGEDNDHEWGLSHLAHAAAGVLFLLHYENQRNEFKAAWDDRPSSTNNTVAQA